MKRRVSRTGGDKIRHPRRYYTPETMAARATVTESGCWVWPGRLTPDGYGQCRYIGKSMLAHGGGSIVNVGSMSGLIVNRPQEQVNYNASKAGVHHLTRSLAAEWGARGVRVNAVAPTYIDTDMNRYVHEDAQMYRHWVGGTPMNRLGRVDEVASVVLFLASEASSLMTGSIVLADGGYVCW